LRPRPPFRAGNIIFDASRACCASWERKGRRVNGLASPNSIAGDDFGVVNAVFKRISLQRPRRGREIADIPSRHSQACAALDRMSLSW